MRILVTGGAGFIGSHTVDALLSSGHEVRILDNLQKPVHLTGKPAWVPAEAEFVLGDVRDPKAWETCLAGMDAVFHLAAYQDYLPDFSTFFHVNAVGTALLYETAVRKKLDLARVVVASSQFVAGEGLHECLDCGARFAPGPRPESRLAQGLWEHECPACKGRTKWLPTPETYASPPNAYAMAKHSQELQALTFGQRYGIPSVAMRYSIVQGPRQSFYNAYSGACRIFSLHYYFGKPPAIYEDGLQCRDFVNIADVVRANVMALTDARMPGAAWNVGGGRAWTVTDFARIVKAEMESRLGRTLPPPEMGGRYRFGDTRHAVSDITRLRALGWEPENGPGESVRGYADYLFDQDNVEDILDYAKRTMKDMNVVRSVKGT